MERRTAPTKKLFGQAAQRMRLEQQRADLDRHRISPDQVSGWLR
jgi:hypothetical protein